MTVFKTFEDLLSQPTCLDLFMTHISTSFKFLDATSDFLVLDKQEQLLCLSSGLPRKPSSLKLCPVIIDTLKKIYSST